MALRPRRTCFVIDPKGIVVYAGAIDDNNSADPSVIPTSTNYVAAALDAAMAGNKVEISATKSYGCSVEYANEHTARMSWPARLRAMAACSRPQRRHSLQSARNHGTIPCMKMRTHDDVVFLSAKRTPFGAFMGGLKSQTATDLGVAAAKAAIAAAGIHTSDIDDIVFGNVMQTSKDAIYLARHIGLRCEVPVATPALTVNRLCGSGFQAIVNGAEQITLGHAQCVLVGGAESMTQAPHVVRGARTGLGLGQGEFEDSLWSALTDTYVNMPMAITAENLAIQYGLNQSEVDAYAVRSQANYARAKAEGFFKDELIAMDFTEGRKNVTISEDEHPRPQTTVEGLQKLPKVFKKDGVIHAGAASGICDGAAALVMCSRSFAEKKGLKPIGALVNYGYAGCDPKVMGIGPVPATKMALERAGLSLPDMDLVEVNEAFAPQVMAVQRELQIPDSVFNIDGGAIAVGHPLAASGARIVTHLLHALNRRAMRYGLGSACIGGGQGITVIVKGGRDA